METTQLEMMTKVLYFFINIYFLYSHQNAIAIESNITTKSFLNVEKKEIKFKFEIKWLEKKMFQLRNQHEWNWREDWYNNNNNYNKIIRIPFIINTYLLYDHLDFLIDISIWRKNNEFSWEFYGGNSYANEFII